MIITITIIIILLHRCWRSSVCLRPAGCCDATEDGRRHRQAVLRATVQQHEAAQAKLRAQLAQAQAQAQTHGSDRGAHGRPPRPSVIESRWVSQ
jgi:hypothetical protein